MSVTINKCISVILSIKFEGDKIVTNSKYEQGFIMRTLTQLYHRQHGLIAAPPKNGNWCVNGAEDEYMTIYHIMLVTGLFTSKPDPGVCGCHFVQNIDDIKTNYKEVTELLKGTNPKFIVDSLLDLEKFCNKCKISSEERWFIDYVKTEKTGEIVYVKAKFPIYDPDVLFSGGKSYYVPEPKSKAAKTGQDTPKTTGGEVRVYVYTKPTTTKVWEKPLTAEPQKKVTRVHIKPEAIREETEQLRQKIILIKEKLQEREKQLQEVNAAKEERDKVKDEYEKLLAMMTEIDKKLLE
jgi:hypothetical protein